jgi:O-antigen ligase
MTSVGKRLEMWKASVMLIKQDYGLGCGDNCYYNGAKNLFENKQVGPGAIQQTEPHNYYLKVLVEQGIVGLILLLSILGIPLSRFLSVLKSVNSNTPKIYALIGASMTLSILDFLISDSTFDSHANVTLYALIIAILLAQIKYESLVKVWFLSYSFQSP